MDSPSKLEYEPSYKRLNSELHPCDDTQDKHTADSNVDEQIDRLNDDH